MAERRLLGRTQPRLWTPPLRPLTRRTTRGYEAAEFADIIGEPFLPWQRWLAIHALELHRDGTYRFQIVIVLVARQNGKSTFKRTVSLYRLYVDGARLVLGVAQDVGLAREQWQYALDTIESSAELAPELAKVRRVNGDEWFRVADREIEYEDDQDDESLTLTAGGRYKIAASNRKAGRGLSVDELNIDELREQQNWAAWSALSKTTMARPNAQTWCMSNAAGDEAVVLNRLRDRALAGANPRIGLFEWSGEDDCPLDDWAQLRQANPGLGRTVSESAIRTALDTDPPAVFRTEVLCQRVDQLDGAISFPAWKDCADPAGNLDAYRNRIAAVFDIAPDGEHATLAVAAKTADGRPRIEIAGAWKTTDQARAELPGLLARIRPAGFGWFAAGPAAAMATTLRPLALTYNKRAGKRKRGPADIPGDGELTGAKVSEVCQELADLVRARGIIQPSDPLLDAQVRAVAKLTSGDGWRFTRRGPGHCDAVYAAAGAVSVSLGLPEPRRASMRVVA